MNKKYRVNGTEHFNLYSMYEHLKCLECEMFEAPSHVYSMEQFNDLENRLEEVEMLMKKAPYVGSLVDWKTLKRIREIKNERQMIRYCCSLNAGSTEEEAALAFDV